MRVIITGGSGGLGKAIVKHMHYADAIIDWSISGGVDVSDYISVKRAAINIIHPIDILINCAGVNNIEWFPKTDEAMWDTIMDTNAKGIYLVTSALIDRLRGGTILNIVSNASHKPMTGSLVYNASKAAAHIMTLQMDRELGKTHKITVFGISPNKLKNTYMSDYIDRRVTETRGWTKEQALQYQLSSLPAGEETDPNTLAEFISFLLSKKERHKYLAGTIIPYGA